MPRLALLLIIAVVSLTAQGKGMGWAYTMTGTAFDVRTKTPLRNTPLIIGRDTVTTDSTGHYEVTVNGVTCDRGSRWRIRRCNEKAYGTMLIRRLANGRSRSIRSHWRTFAFCDEGRAGKSPISVYQRDLYIK